MQTSWLVLLRSANTAVPLPAGGAPRPALVPHGRPPHDQRRPGHAVRSGADELWHPRGWHPHPLAAHLWRGCLGSTGEQGGHGVLRTCVSSASSGSHVVGLQTPSLATQEDFACVQVMYLPKG